MEVDIDLIGYAYVYGSGYDYKLLLLITLFLIELIQNNLKNLPYNLLIWYEKLSTHA